MYSVETCKEMINSYIEAEKSVLLGQSYKIGSRELTRADLTEIIKARQLWEHNLTLAQNIGRRTQSVQVIIGDL